MDLNLQSRHINTQYAHKETQRQGNAHQTTEMSLYPYRDSYYQRQAITSAVWGCGNTGTVTHC